MPGRFRSPFIKAADKIKEAPRLQGQTKRRARFRDPSYFLHPVQVSPLRQVREDRIREDMREERVRERKTAIPLEHANGSARPGLEAKGDDVRIHVHAIQIAGVNVFPKEP